MGSLLTAHLVFSSFMPVQGVHMNPSAPLVNPQLLFLSKCAAFAMKQGVFV